MTKGQGKGEVIDIKGLLERDSELEVDPAEWTTRAGTQGGSGAVLTIMNLKLLVVVAAAVGMWAMRERCPSAASYPQPCRQARR